jgi:GntR family transcriptional regulator, transcriptional repressor for pyruvate dehydrogenase complex
MAKSNKNIGSEALGMYQRPSYSRRYSAVVPSDEKKRTLDGISYELEMVDAPPKQPELIVNALAKYIVKSGMKPGDKLPAGRELSRILGVASCSLREALIILQTLGVIQARHGSGWYISRFDPSTSFKLLSPIIENFSGMDLDEVMQTRLTNEPVIARLAAENITPELLDALRENLEGMKEKEDKTFWEEYRKYDKNFHTILAQASNNRMLAMLSTILSGIHFSVKWWEISADQQTNYEMAIRHHQKIYDAVKNRDEQGAEKAMREHIESAWETIRRIITPKRMSI